MNKKKFIQLAGIAGVILSLSSCKLPQYATREAKTELPETFEGKSTDTLTVAKVDWRAYFNDPYLNPLIDSALVNNQELNILLQEINMTQNEIMAKKGEYQPTVGLSAGAGGDKVGRYTTQGAFEATTEMEPGIEIPEFVPDFKLGAYATWEIDIWHKLRNAKEAAVKRFLSTQEGRNFAVTNVVSEIANSYYELLALDNQLEILDKNITLQQNALNAVKLQKESAKVTELAVRRFEAEVMNTKAMRFDINQAIVETENKINLLIGRAPQQISRDPNLFSSVNLDSVAIGTPGQLLENRPDIRKAEHELEAVKLDVKVAKAGFYPSLSLSAGVGLNAFNPTYLFRPESILYNIAGDLAAPLINRKGIKAEYLNANARQMQAVLNYERTVLTAYIEVVNQVANINNLNGSVQLKTQQVEALTNAISIANALFASAHADYMEVLLTQRDALEAKFELVDLKLKSMHCSVQIYKALGGGWR